MFIFNTGRNVGYAAVFADITRRGALPDKASIHTAEMTVIKVAMREIYGILAEVFNQGKQITLCKVPANIRIKGN